MYAHAASGVKGEAVDPQGFPGFFAAQTARAGERGWRPVGEASADTTASNVGHCASLRHRGIVSC